MQETCAFDSLLQLVTSAIATHVTYQNAVQSSSDNIFQLARSILENGKILATHYYERASILQNLALFRNAITDYTRGIRRLNANCNAAHLAEYLFENEPSCVYSKSCSYDTANVRRTVTCNVNVDILLQEGLQHMQRAIDDVRNISSKCRSCDTLAKTTITYGNHIIIDTSIFTDHTYPNRRSDIKHNLNSISKTVILDNIKYILAGVVHYIQSDNSNNGHYIAISYTGIHSYEYDDLKKKRAIAKSTQDIKPHVILYVRCNDYT